MRDDEFAEAIVDACGFMAFVELIGIICYLVYIAVSFSFEKLTQGICWVIRRSQVRPLSGASKLKYGGDRRNQKPVERA